MNKEILGEIFGVIDDMLGDCEENIQLSQESGSRTNVEYYKGSQRALLKLKRNLEVKYEREVASHAV